jgi:hypothetical protein
MTNRNDSFPERANTHLRVPMMTTVGPPPAAVLFYPPMPAAPGSLAQRAPPENAAPGILGLCIDR